MAGLEWNSLLDHQGPKLGGRRLGLSKFKEVRLMETGTPLLVISDSSFSVMLWVIKCYFNYLRNSHLVKFPLATMHDAIWESLPLSLSIRIFAFLLGNC